MDVTRGIVNAVTPDQAASPTRIGMPRASDERAKVVELAREFESLVVLQMIRQMRQSMLSEEQEPGFGFGSETMTDTIDVELARHVSRVGGLGLADVLTAAIDRQVAGSRVAGEEGTPAVATTELADRPNVPAVPVAPTAGEPGTGQGPRVPLPLSTRLTSGFGWRDDPFGRGARFHSGVDIGAAYGREVPSVADGRVVFAGEQGGYGQTVVVQHDDGVTTRYGHLSGYTVAAGDRVRAGEVIGRVGSTGRSTGPHLHFEVLVGGQAVNPVVAASRYADALKVMGLDADSSNSKVSRLGVVAGVEHED